MGFSASTYDFDGQVITNVWPYSLYSNSKMQGNNNNNAINIT